MTVQETITKLKHEWSHPRNEMPVGDLEPMAFACKFANEGASEDELSTLEQVLPPSLLQFWRCARWGRLFQDCTYGQWGLEILTPSDAASETIRQRQKRPTEYDDGDLVVGRFLGDSDVLVVRCKKAPLDYGKVLVALPLDPRQDWYSVGNSFEEFLTNYVQANGAKYWEEQGPDKGTGKNNGDSSRPEKMYR